MNTHTKTSGYGTAKKTLHEFLTDVRKEKRHCDISRPGGGELFKSSTQESWLMNFKASVLLFSSRTLLFPSAGTGLLLWNLLPLLLIYIIHIMLTAICSGWMRLQSEIRSQTANTSWHSFPVMSSGTSLNLCPGFLLVEGSEWVYLFKCCDDSVLLL